MVQDLIGLLYILKNSPLKSPLSKSRNFLLIIYLINLVSCRKITKVLNSAEIRFKTLKLCASKQLFLCMGNKYITFVKMLAILAMPIFVHLLFRKSASGSYSRKPLMAGNVQHFCSNKLPAAIRGGKLGEATSVAHVCITFYVCMYICVYKCVGSCCCCFLVAVEHLHTYLRVYLLASLRSLRNFLNISKQCYFYKMRQHATFGAQLQLCIHFVHDTYMRVYSQHKHI